MSWTVRFDHVPTTMGAYVYTRDFTGDVFVRDLKLEKGNKATDWSPAPEDGEIYISATPPTAPILTGKQWLDKGVNPWALRSWIGASVSNERERSYIAGNVNPAIIDRGRVNGWVDFLVTTSPVQVGSGAASPSNYRNILPIRELIVSNCGKNLFNYDVFCSVGVVNGTASFADGSVVLTATADDCYTTNWTSLNGEDMSYRIPVVAGETICMSWAHSGADGYVYLFFNGSTDTMVYGLASAQSLVATVPSGASYVTCRVGVTSSGGVATYKNIQIESAASPTAYEPFSGNYSRISMPEGFYGGHYNISTDTVRNDWVLLTFNGTESWESWSTNAGTYRMRLSFADYESPASSSAVVEGYCTSYAAISADGTYSANQGFSGETNGGGICFYDANYQTADAWKAYLSQMAAAGTPVKVLLKRATQVFSHLSASLPSGMTGANRLAVNLGELYLTATVSGWETVNDTTQIEAALNDAALLAQSAQDKANEVDAALESRVRLDSEGLHVGDTSTDNELLLRAGSSPSINFILGGTAVSTISHNYYRMHNMEIRVPQVGGFVFQAVTD